MLCCILFDFVNRLSVRVPAGHNNLAVFPVFAEGAPALSYLLLEEAQRRLPWPAGACGVVAAINGRIVCADLFDSPSSGMAAPALPTPEKAFRFLYVPPDTPMETFASPGIGQSLRFRTPSRLRALGWPGRPGGGRGDKTR